MERQATERRAHARVPHRARATIKTGRGDLSAEVFDVSLGGFGLRMAAPVSPGEFIRIRVQLPTERGMTWFDPDAVVSRVQHGSGQDTVGVCFVSPPPHLQQLLSDRVRDHLLGRSRKRAPKPEENRDLDLEVLFRAALEDVQDDS